MNTNGMLASLTLLLALLSPSAVTAQNGMMQFEVPFATTLYVPCLGEDVDIELVARVRTHLVESQNGRVHYVENWFMEGAAQGVDSGNTWFAHGASPFVLNAGAVQANNQWVANLVYEPLDGGRKFREKVHFQLVMDANGVVQVDQGFQQFHCIGS